MEFAAPQNLQNYRITQFHARKVQANYLETDVIQSTIIIIGAYLLYPGNIPVPVSNADVVLGAIGTVQTMEDGKKKLFLRSYYPAAQDINYSDNLRALLSIGVVPDFMETNVHTLTLYDNADTAQEGFIIALVKK